MPTPERLRMQQNDVRVCKQACEGRAITHEMFFFKKYFAMPNPELFLQSALEESGMSERLEAMTIYTHCEMEFFNDPLESPLPSSLLCVNVTKLTVDPMYLIDQKFRLNCPNLRILNDPHQSCANAKMARRYVAQALCGHARS